MNAFLWTNLALLSLAIILMLVRITTSDYPRSVSRGMDAAAVVGNVGFLVWVAILLFTSCAPRPQPSPPFGGSPSDSAEVVALRDEAAFAARAEATASGWRLVSVGKFAEIAAWWRLDPFWTIGLPIVQLAPDRPDTVRCASWTIKGKTTTVCVPPGAPLSFTFRDGDGANLGREYFVVLLDQMPGDLHFAKYHHGTNVLAVRPLDLERIR